MQFYNIPPVYCQAVLKGIGRQLLRLSFNDCLYIDLTNLLPCIQLEQLDFDSLSTVRTPTAIHFDGPFLPRLKKLVDLSSSCLGLWSSLIETERPLLTELRVHCAHIGISSVSHFQWTDIPTLWPSLRTLNVKSAKGLTLGYPLSSYSTANGKAGIIAPSRSGCDPSALPRRKGHGQEVSSRTETRFAFD